MSQNVSFMGRMGDGPENPYLGITVNPVVELLIGFRSPIDSTFVALGTTCQFSRN